MQFYEGLYIRPQKVRHVHVECERLAAGPDHLHLVQGQVVGVGAKLAGVELANVEDTALGTESPLAAGPRYLRHDGGLRAVEVGEKAAHVADADDGAEVTIWTRRQAQDLVLSDEESVLRPDACAGIQPLERQTPPAALRKRPADARVVLANRGDVDRERELARVVDRLHAVIDETFDRGRELFEGDQVLDVPPQAVKFWRQV